MITALCVATAFLIGALTLHAIYGYAEMQGYLRGLDEAEQIICEVKGHENNDKTDTTRSV